MMPNNGFKEAQYKECSVERLLQVLLQNFDEFNLEISPLYTDQSTSPSTEVGSDFDSSLDSWLRGSTDKGVYQSGEICTTRNEPMLSPDVIRAPLKSIGPINELY